MKRRLGLLSDTHGHEDAWMKASLLWGNSLDAVLHAGDVLSSDVDTGLAGMIRTAPFPVIISLQKTLPGRRHELRDKGLHD